MSNEHDNLNDHDRAILDAIEEEESQTNRELRWCFPCHRKSMWRDNLGILGLPVEEMRCLGCMHREWKTTGRFSPGEG